MSNCSSNNNSYRIENFNNEEFSKNSAENTFDSINLKGFSGKNSPRTKIRSHGNRSRADSIKSNRTLTSYGNNN